MIYDFPPFNIDGAYSKTILVKDNKAVVKVDYHIGSAIMKPWLCGYVALPKKSIPKRWWGKYEALDAIEIHGGITYADVQGDYAIFGFDVLTAATRTARICTIRKS